MERTKIVKLGDVLNFKRGHDLPKIKMQDGKIPVAGSNGIIGYHNEETPIHPCITIGRSGNVGTPYIYDKCWAHNTVLYVDDFKGNDPKYLYYLLKTIPLSSFGGGSAVPTLNRNHIHPIEIKYFENIKTQKKIASFLSSLDDKIELNRRINENLEQQAQALFKSWFIDFEPFKDGKFVDSELGMIPEGWKVGNLEELVEVKYGKDHKKLAPGTIPVYGSGGIMRYVDQYLYNKESVLIPRKGSLNNVMYINRPFWTVDTMFYTRMKIEGIAKFIYLFMSPKDLLSMNSGSAVPSMTVDILNKIQIITPPINIIQKFECIMKPIFTKMDLCSYENQKLSQLRDTLLPRLMSGELEIKDNSYD